MATKNAFKEKEKISSKLIFVLDSTSIRQENRTAFDHARVQTIGGAMVALWRCGPQSEMSNGHPRVSTTFVFVFVSVFCVVCFRCGMMLGHH